MSRGHFDYEEYKLPVMREFPKRSWHCLRTQMTKILYNSAVTGLDEKYFVQIKTLGLDLLGNKTKKV